MKLPRTSQALTEIIARIRAGVRGRGDFTPGLERDVSLSYDVGSASRIGYRSSQDRAWGADFSVAANPGFASKLGLATTVGGGVNFRVLGTLWRNTTAGNLTMSVGATGRDDAAPAFMAAATPQCRFTENSLSQNELAPIRVGTQNTDVLEYGIIIYRFVLAANSSFLLPIDWSGLPGSQLFLNCNNLNTALGVSVWGEVF